MIPTMPMPEPQLIEIIEEIESSCNPDAIGDHGLAYGCMQIHQATLDDFKKWNKGKIIATIDVDALELKDLLGVMGREVSHVIFRDYMAHYATEERLGRPVTNVDRARIWNGGPNGWKKSATRGYGAKFAELAGQSEVAMGGLAAQERKAPRRKSNKKRA